MDEALAAARNKLSGVKSHNNTKINYWHFEKQAWVSHPCSNNIAAKLPSTFTMLSMNIWCEAHNMVERMTALAALLEKENVDVALIQENTDLAQQTLQNIPSIQQHYYMSEFTGQEKGFKVSIWSKFAFDELRLDDVHGRPVITGWILNRQVCLCSVHLTSGNNTFTRQKQLNQVYTQLVKQAAPTVIVAGDFNFCMPDDNVQSFTTMYDVWETLHGAQGGATQGPHRLDRVTMSKQSQYKPNGIVVTANTPIAKNLFISDHFGLLTKLSCQENKKYF